MLNIQSAMLALLGFLTASLLVLLLAPAYWRRAVRLTTERLKQSMPLTEAEIRADKDKLRAEYAIKVHRLEVKAEQSAHDAARQQIELNRRDAAISALEGEIGRLKTSLDEHENARRVLEQTITERFPRLEQRLGEARRLLAQRDQEVATLSETAARQAKALEEASQSGAQQRDEMMRLNSALAAISVRTREGIADPKFDAEVALRTELEGARLKLRQQTALIEQLQAGGAAPATAARGLAALISAPAAVAAQPGSDAVVTGAVGKEETASVAALRGELEAAQSARADLAGQLTAARQEIEDKAVALAGLKAALAAYERGAKDDRTISLKDSRLAMKVRIGTLQAESEQQAAAIQRMRTELAAANEKLARQAAHFMAEMRRLGPAAAGKVAADGRKAAAEGADARAGKSRHAVLARPAEALTSAIASVRGRTGAAQGELGAAEDVSRVRGFLKALGGAAAVKAGAAALAATATAAPPADRPAGDEVPAAVDEPGADGAPKPRRLIERIASVSKA